jgi:hypothetical protein
MEERALFVLAVGGKLVLLLSKQRKIATYPTGRHCELRGWRTHTGQRDKTDFYFGT